jgi:hypothetical protein
MKRIIKAALREGYPLGVKLGALAFFALFPVILSPSFSWSQSDIDRSGASDAIPLLTQSDTDDSYEASPVQVPQPQVSPSTQEKTATQSVTDSADAEEDDDEFDAISDGHSLDFILPVDGDIFYTDDVQILANVQGVEPTGMVLILDGYNYDQPLSLEVGLIRASLKGLHNGVHELKLLILDGSNHILARKNVRFFVRVPEPKKVEHTGPVRQFGRIAARMDVKGAEARNRIQNQAKLSMVDGKPVAGESVTPLAQQIDGALEGSYNLKVYDWEAHGKVLLRTDEDGFRQPSNRFSARINYGPYASLKGGDVYPAFNDLLLNGARLRGGEAKLAVVAKDITWGSLKIARGESRREIPAYVAIYDTGAGTRTDTLSGTFAQTLTAIRVGFGGGSTFDLGITGMMAEDKIGSQSTLDLADSLHGVRPIQNAGTGIDLRVGLWDGRIQIFHDAALTLLTRDKSLGASDGGDIDLEFNPKDYEDLFVLNPTTQGIQYVIQNSQKESDITGFLKANSAWDVGINASIPLNGLVTESEVRYDHMGLLYHTEGNPFLGSDPSDGIHLLQKLLLLDNRLSLALEAGSVNQDLGLNQQQERSYKAEVRWTPVATEPSGWVSLGGSERAPDSDYPYQYHSGFFTVNAGAYQQYVFTMGRLHASTLYGFTQSDFKLSATPVVDTSITATTLLTFPTTRTHIANVSLQLRPRAIDFMPRIAYTFSSNDVQQPLHNVAMGFQQLLIQGRIKGDVGIQIGQYPETVDKNDIMVGETVSLDFRITPTQTARCSEKWIQYGNRRNTSVGAFYEMYF